MVGLLSGPLDQITELGGDKLLSVLLAQERDLIVVLLRDQWETQEQLGLPLIQRVLVVELQPVIEVLVDLVVRLTLNQHVLVIPVLGLFLVNLLELILSFLNVFMVHVVNPEIVRVNLFLVDELL